jgi:plasmid stability protein
VRETESMPILYLRDVPDDVYEELRALAGRERRSLSAEALTLLGEALAHREFRGRFLPVRRLAGEPCRGARRDPMTQVTGPLRKGRE